MVVGPAERVSGAGNIRQSLAGGLRERKGDADVAAMFEHQVGKIVGRDSVIWLDLQCFLVKLLSLLPVAARFHQAAEVNISPEVAWIALKCALIVRNCLIHRSLRDFSTGQ